ncbi:hypothetical protein SDC9_21211 [bioreactor metagenome]|uniref:Zinc-ribbon domain-containing protein n=1 Tax=bioreactor metagenome TaxID=1076179 RepID=A0A644U8V7_9ZZZZ|nr:zinc ribbon domain-containing protein [Methanobrevibacter sp.]MEA4957995.1 zinc ribbon domain-containing protein [Methanobrevibacter sp.]
MPFDGSNFQSNTKFCTTCGAQIHEKAEICPHCGVRCEINDNNIQVNSGGVNLVLFFSSIGAISGIIMALMYFYIIYLYSLNGYIPNSISMYLTLFLMFFSSLSGFLGYWLSLKDVELSILEYIISLTGILIAAMLSFLSTSTIPFLSIATGISPVFFMFLGLMSAVFFILAIFYVYKNKINENLENRGVVL